MNRTSTNKRTFNKGQTHDGTLLLQEVVQQDGVRSGARCNLPATLHVTTDLRMKSSTFIVYKDSLYLQVKRQGEKTFV